MKREPTIGYTIHGGGQEIPNSSLYNYKNNEDNNNNLSLKQFMEDNKSVTSQKSNRTNQFIDGQIEKEKEHGRK